MMFLLTSIYTTVLGALFPLPEGAKEVLGYSPEEAFEILPPAPSYARLAVALPEAQSLFAYKDKRVEQLIWNIKYRKSREAVKIAGYALFEALEIFRKEFEPEETTTLIIVPMPITTRRRRERGFNQCELLTDEIRRLDIQKHFIIEENLLLRTHHTSRQTKKDRTERLESAKGIFSVNKETLEKRGYENKDSAVIIIDDVVTTGSTLKDAIDTMRAAGVEKAYGLSLAH